MGYRDELEAGRDAFGHLIKVWHDRNGWSQRVLPALAERLELGRVHNSQLSNLCNRKLAAPGPELFVALGRINQVLAAEVGPTGLSPQLHGSLQDQPDLLMALQASALPLCADDGAPLGPAQLFEIFVGLRQPPAAFDLRIVAAEAAALSAALAELFTAGRPWRQCREAVLAAYPADKRQRRERFAEVMAGQREYRAEELDLELADLIITLQQLAGADAPAVSPDQLLELLRQQAARLAGDAPLAADAGLSAAIRQRLETSPAGPR